MNSSSSIIISESLSVNPHEAYPRWLLEVCQVASETLSADYNYGLLGLIITNAQWAALPGNTVIDPVTLVAVVRDIPDPQDPGVLANNAAAGASQVHRELAEAARRFRAGKAILVKAILDSLGPQLRRSITSRIHNIIILTIPEIMAEMTTRFGVFSAADVAAYTALLAIPLSSGDKCEFETFSTRFIDNIAVLERANQPVSAYEQMWKFESATSTQPSVAHAIQSYRDNVPTLSLQSLTDMIPYISARLSNLPSASLGYASAAVSTTHRQGSVSGGRGRGGYVSRGDRSSARFYCFHHGSNHSHHGSECKFMKSSPVHTDTMIAARNSSTGGKA